MKNELIVGAFVQWKWMGRYISGIVKEIHLKPTVRIIKSKRIKRNGCAKNPAYLVESNAGNLALKLQTELITEEIKPTLKRIKT